MAKISGLKVKWRGDSDSAGTDTSAGGVVGGEGMGSGSF
jgi:hypothetical protein